MPAKRGSLKAAFKIDQEDTPANLKTSADSQNSRSQDQPRKNTPPSRQGKKAIMAHFDPVVIKQLKQIGLDSDKTVQAMLTEALNDFFAKNGKPPIAS